jgi:hypothetical protein
LSLNSLVRFKRRKSHAAALQLVQSDAMQYKIAWDALRQSEKPSIMTETIPHLSLIDLWKDSLQQPVEISGRKTTIRQDCADFELLYFLAEFVNEPFNEMVSIWCSGRRQSGQHDQQQFFNWTKHAPFEIQPRVIPGPIKSVQRSIEKVIG